MSAIQNTQVTSGDMLDNRSLVQSEHDRMVEVLHANANNYRIGCEKLRQLAKEHGFKGRDLGKIAKENKIKIVACELGCF